VYAVSSARKVNILKHAYCPFGEKVENSRLPSYQYFAFKK